MPPTWDEELKADLDELGDVLKQSPTVVGRLVGGAGVSARAELQVEAVQLSRHEVHCLAEKLRSIKALD